NHLCRNHRSFLISLPETQQRIEALSFRGFAFQLPVENLQLVDLRMQACVFSARAPQCDISVPNVSYLRKRPGAAMLERHQRFHGPIPDQPHLMVPLDLESQQQYLREDQAGQQSQRTMAGNGCVQHPKSPGSAERLKQLKAWRSTI